MGMLDRRQVPPPSPRDTGLDDAQAVEGEQADGVGLEGRVALVTGASSGIGLAISLALARLGATVWMTARRREILAAAATADGDLRPLAVDLEADGAAAKVCGMLAAVDAELDILVHCAGTILLGDVREASAGDFDSQYRGNLRGPFALTQAFLPLLSVSGGDIVFVNSTACLQPRRGVAQFAATQAALRAFADSLRDEVNDDGIRVLSIFPGRTATPRQARLHEIEGHDYVPERLMQPDQIASMVAAALQLTRTAEVTEIVMRPSLKPLDGR
jgi:NADP-dependent 3-hydroxy acid dehydrogenase YdfG